MILQDDLLQRRDVQVRPPRRRLHQRQELRLEGTVGQDADELDTGLADTSDAGCVVRQDHGTAHGHRLPPARQLRLQPIRCGIHLLPWRPAFGVAHRDASFDDVAVLVALVTAPGCALAMDDAVQELHLERDDRRGPDEQQIGLAAAVEVAPEGHPLVIEQPGQAGHDAGLALLSPWKRPSSAPA